MTYMGLSKTIMARPCAGVAGIRAFLCFAATCGVVFAGDAPGGGTDPPPPRRSMLTGGFAVELQPPDRFVGTVGAAPTMVLWKDHILAARTRVLVAGGDLTAIWLEPLLQLKKQRPETEVICILERPSLGNGEDLAAQLVKGGIVMYYRTSIASTIGLPPSTPLRGLILVRDDSSVLLVSGAGHTGDSIVWGNLLESEPIAKEYSTRLTLIRSNLPKYPETQLLFTSGF